MFLRWGFFYALHLMRGDIAVITVTDFWMIRPAFLCGSLFFPTFEKPITFNQMKILFSVHAWSGVGKWQSGAETTVNDLASMLVKAGHTCKALIHYSDQIGLHDSTIQNGVHLFPANDNNVRNLFEWANIVVTHLDKAFWTMNQCKLRKLPVVFYSHNTQPYKFVREYTGKIGVVYNSQWMKNQMKFPHPDCIINPPTDPAHYDVHEDPFYHKYVTIVNLNENKGVLTFYDAARALPHIRFLGVRGSYDTQIYDRSLMNVRYLPQMPDIRDVIRMTKILVMPSAYESWGKTATEFACSGVPVVCSMATGLMENMGETGIYVFRKHTDRFIHWIDKLFNDEQFYRSTSERVKYRAYQLAPTNVVRDFENLCNFIR